MTDSVDPTIFVATADMVILLSILRYTHFSRLYTIFEFENNYSRLFNSDSSRVSRTIENFDMTCTHFRTLAGLTCHDAYQMLRRVQRLNCNVVHVLRIYPAMISLNMEKTYPDGISIKSS